MRFGIIAMQIDALIPPNLSLQETFNKITVFDQSEVARDLFEMGFNPIEIGCNLGLFLPHIYEPAAVEKLASLTKEIGVTYTLHLPLWSVEPSTPLEPIRKGSVHAILNAIQDTLLLDPELYVLHATGSLAAEFYRMNFPDVAKEFALQKFQSCARESIKSILKETGIPSKKIALETIEFPFYMTLALVKELDLSMCFDTGHVIIGLSGPVDLYEAFDACLPWLGEVHLHDGQWQGSEGKVRYRKDHQPLGKGDLNTNHFLNILNEANFDGPIIFELSSAEALESIEYIRKIHPELLD